MGSNFLILTACGVITESVKDAIRASFESSAASGFNEEFARHNFKYAAEMKRGDREYEEKEIHYEFVDYEEIPLTRETAVELVKYIKDNHFDVIVGVGGGKAQDFVRAAGHYMDITMALVPTVAATNASATNYCVIYNAEGTRITDFWKLRECQQLVLADPNILINAPLRTLSAGIGDTISTFYEALNVAKRTGNTEFYPASGWAYIKASIELFYKCGPEAYKLAKEKKVSPAYETVISLILHSVGPIRACCVSGIGHIIDEGLITFESCKKLMHGALVGYGVIPMMVFDNEDQEKIEKYIQFGIDVGIPVSFEELGIQNVSREELLKACETAVHGTMIQSFPYKVTAEELVDIMLKAETIVTEYLRNIQ